MLIVTFKYPFDAECRYAECRHAECRGAKAKDNGREPKTCMGRVFNFKLGRFVTKQSLCWHSNSFFYSRQLDPGACTIKH